jgi:hypothetical protein
MARSRELFHIIVASMKVARDSFITDQLVSLDMLMHKTAAISLLRERISSITTTAMVDDTTILTMLLLALLEDALGNHSAYRIHREQVSRLTQVKTTSRAKFQAIVRQ